MTAIHFHLMITHVPIVCTLIASVLLLAGLIWSAPPLRKAAYVMFIVCAITAFAASASGEQSEIALKNDSRFVPEYIEAHQQYAGTAFVWSVICGVLSIGAWLAEAKHWRFGKPLMMGIVIVSLLNFGLYAYVGYQGGKIRHDEIRE